MAYVYHDMNYIQITSVPNGEIAATGLNLNDSSTPMGAYFFAIFSPSDLTTIYTYYYNIYLLPLSIHSINNGSTERILVI